MIFTRLNVDHITDRPQGRWINKTLSCGKIATSGRGIRVKAVLIAIPVALINDRILSTSLFNKFLDILADDSVCVLERF